MARKTKPKAPAIEAAQSKEDCARRIRAIGTLRREIIAIEGNLSAQIAVLKEAAEALATPFRERLAEQEQAVQAYCETNKDRLTQGGKKKSFDFGSGEVKWRQRPPSVRIRGIPAVIDALRELGLGRFLRQKTEVDKEAMLKEPEVAAAVAGVTVVSGVEDFAIEPVDEKLSDQASPEVSGAA